MDQINNLDNDKKREVEKLLEKMTKSPEKAKKTQKSEDDAIFDEFLEES